MKNESSGIVQIVHHDRLIPMKESVPVEVSEKASHSINNKGDNTPKIVPESNNHISTEAICPEEAKIQSRYSQEWWEKLAIKRKI